MEVQTISKYNRISPKKVRMIAGQLSGKQVGFALESLRFMTQKASLMLSKTIKTAQADATHNFKLDGSLLIIKTIDVTGGPSLKRFIPRSRGMGHPILKRSSHIRVVLMEKSAEVLPVATANTKLAVKEEVKMEASAPKSEVNEKEKKPRGTTKNN